MRVIRVIHGVASESNTRSNEYYNIQREVIMIIMQRATNIPALQT